MEAAFRISTTRGGCYRPRAPPFHTFLHLRLAISSEPRRRPPSSPFSIPRDVPRRSACSSFFYRSPSFVGQRIQARLLFVFYRLLFPISPVRLSYHYSSFVWYLQLLCSTSRIFSTRVALSPTLSSWLATKDLLRLFGSFRRLLFFFHLCSLHLTASPTTALRFFATIARLSDVRGYRVRSPRLAFHFRLLLRAGRRASAPLLPDRRPQGFSYFRSNVGSISPSRLSYGLQPVSRSFCRYVTVPIICRGRIRLSRSWSVEAFRSAPGFCIANFFHDLLSSRP